MHNIRQDWCCEAAEVSCNLHWLFDCVTNTHWTDGSTQRITEPCRLLGNTCPLWQTSTTTHITWTALQHMSKGIGAGWCSFYPSKSKHAVLGTNIQHTVEGTMCPAECRIKSYNCNISMRGADARLICTPTLTWTVAEYLHSSPELIFSPDIEQKHNWTTFFAFMYNISLENTVLTLCAESFPHRSQIVLFCRTNVKMLNF